MTHYIEVPPECAANNLITFCHYTVNPFAEAVYHPFTSLWGWLFIAIFVATCVGVWMLTTEINNKSRSEEN